MRLGSEWVKVSSQEMGKGLGCGKSARTGRTSDKTSASPASDRIKRDRFMVENLHQQILQASVLSRLSLGPSKQNRLFLHPVAVMSNSSWDAKKDAETASQGMICRLAQPREIETGVAMI